MTARTLDTEFGSRDPGVKRVCLLIQDSELTDQRIINQAKALAGEGYEVIVLMPGTRKDQYQTYSLEGFRVIGCPCSPLPLQEMLRQMRIGPWLDAIRILHDSREELRNVARCEVLLEQPDRPMHDCRGNAGGGWKSIAKELVRQILLRSGLWPRFQRSLLLSWEAGLLCTARYLRPDIIHVADLPALRVGKQLQTELNRPLVFDAHEWYSAPGEMRLELVKYWQQRELEDISAPNLLITVNRFLADHMARANGTAPQAWNIIHNTSPRFERPMPSTIQKIRNEIFPTEWKNRTSSGDPSGFLLLYVGYLLPNRGIENLLEAMAILPDDVALTIVGDGPLGAPLRQQAVNLGLGNRVRLLGTRPRNEIPLICAGAEVGLVTQLDSGPNLRYCSPNRLSDYVQAGLILGCSNLPFLNEFVERYQCGVVFDPLLPRSIAQALAPLVHNSDMKRSLALNALRAGEVFNWENEKDTFLKLYSTLPSACN